MKLIKILINWLLNKKEESITISTYTNHQIYEDEEIEAIYLQSLEDKKWEMRIKQKATQRYLEMVSPRKGVIDSSRYTDTYQVLHEPTAKYKDGIDRHVQDRFLKMLRLKHTVPQGTIPKI